MKQKNLKTDLFLMGIFPLVSVLLSLLIGANFFLSTILFFGVPAIWLSYKNPRLIVKSILFSILFSLPIVTIVDYFAALDNSWVVPASIIPYRLFGLIPFEDYVWAIFLAYFVVIFYEHFFDRGKNRIIEKRFKYYIVPSFFVAIVFSFLVLIGQRITTIPYLYWWGGLAIIVLPILIFLYKFPEVTPKFLKTGGYFSIVGFLSEITGLHLNQWKFTGQNFIGWVEIVKFRFPLEEFLFYIVLSAMWILTYYEFFDDDRV